jgi:hypothetical protein
MKRHHLIIAGAAAATFAYYYFIAKTSTNAQSIPGAASVYNIGYNFAKSGSFSLSAPAA